MGADRATRTPSSWPGPGAFGALDDLDVEPDGKQVLHVEGVHDDVAGDQVVERAQLEPLVLLLEPLATLEHLVDLFARLHEQPEVVEPGRLEVLGGFGEQDELPVVGLQQVVVHLQDLGLHHVPAEHTAVERLEVGPELVGEASPSGTSAPCG